MSMPAFFEETEVSPRGDGTVTIVFKRRSLREIEATGVATVVGPPAALAKLRDQITELLGERPTP